jgi:ammonia channel protein AmtB
MSVGVVSFQWFFWGYSLTFSHTANSYIGNLENIGFRNVLDQPSVGSLKIPDLLFAVYQGMFAAITYVYVHLQSTQLQLANSSIGQHSPSVQQQTEAVCYLA